MIQFNNLKQEPPYIFFKKIYKQAINAGQKNIEAISISSYNKQINEVDSRYVNLKFVNDDKFIFFTNYDSPKAIAFKNHSQISAIFFWSSVNCQIRMKAKISTTSAVYNDRYFRSRDIDKNALAISSNQSKIIESYNDVKKKYDDIKINKDLTKCPSYWGGFYFVPYYFEFWQGHPSRLNEREFFKLKNNQWENGFLEP